MTRQVDIKTAVALISAGIALAGGGGTVIGSRAAASTEAKVEKHQTAIESQSRLNADYEARLRTLERDLLQSTTEIKSDLKHIKSAIDKLVER